MFPSITHFHIPFLNQLSSVFHKHYIANYIRHLASEQKFADLWTTHATKISDNCHTLNYMIIILFRYTNICVEGEPTSLVINYMHIKNIRLKLWPKLHCQSHLKNITQTTLVPPSNTSCLLVPSSRLLVVVSQIYAEPLFYSETPYPSPSCYLPLCLSSGNP